MAWSRGKFLLVEMKDGLIEHVQTYKTLKGAQKQRDEKNRFNDNVGRLGKARAEITLVSAKDLQQFIKNYAVEEKPARPPSKRRHIHGSPS